MRGTGGAVFAGILLIIAGVLWMLQGLAGIVRGRLHRERELLDHYERQYLGMDTPGRRHHRSRGGFRRLFGSGLGALAGNLHRRHLGVCELRVHPVGAWWALTIIFIDLWVIHSLFVHRRLRD